MLVDQKMNDGIPVPFFGRDAMTASALAELALRYDCPIVPTHVVRVKGPMLRLVIEPPLQFTPTGDRHADVAALMAMVNQRVESWVRDNPEQWLWLHNRWPN
jgi:KDO2-lipid IV(A) lauroyltransferase